jgi:hypothetical protein
MLNELRSYSARHGAGRTAIRIFLEGFKHDGILRHSRFVVLYPDCVNEAAYDASLPYERRMLHAADVARLASQLPQQLPDDFVAQARLRGDLCHVILDGETLVSFGWYAVHTARLFDRRIEFSSDFVYMYHGYTRPEFRGQRLHALGLACAVAHFRQTGKRGLISTVNATNYASLASIKRLGFAQHGSILQIGRGPFSVRFATPATKPFAIRFHE